MHTPPSFPAPEDMHPWIAEYLAGRLQPVPARLAATVVVVAAAVVAALALSRWVNHRMPVAAPASTRTATMMTATLLVGRAALHRLTMSSSRRSSSAVD